MADVKRKPGGMDRFQQDFMRLMGGLGSNLYVMSIRDAFATTVPVTIGAALFVLLNNVFFAEGIGCIPNMPFSPFLSELCIQGYNGTLGMLGLMVTFLIGMFLGKHWGGTGALEGMVGLGCYVMLLPNSTSITSVDGEVFSAAGLLTQTFTSSSTMLLGILAALFSSILLHKLTQFKKLKVSMPDGVPPAVAGAFNKLVPAVIVMMLFAFIEVAVRWISGMSVPDVVVWLLQKPLIGGFQSLIGIELYVFLATFVFVFGIHGAFVFGAISSPILLTSLQQNIEAISAGAAAPNIVTQPFLDCYVYMGGGGTMISLIIALLLFSRRKDEQTITRLGLLPGIFNISEPIMFGLPVVFNPVYAIPFCIVPCVSTLIAYAATSWNLVSCTYLTIPWITPPVVSGFLATGGDWRASVLQVAIILVGIAIYAPFVIASNRLGAKGEAAE